MGLRRLLHPPQSRRPPQPPPCLTSARRNLEVPEGLPRPDSSRALAQHPKASPVPPVLLWGGHGGSSGFLPARHPAPRAPCPTGTLPISGLLLGLFCSKPHRKASALWGETSSKRATSPELPRAHGDSGWNFAQLCPGCTMWKWPKLPAPTPGCSGAPATAAGATLPLYPWRGSQHDAGCTNPDKTDPGRARSLWREPRSSSSSGRQPRRRGAAAGSGTLQLPAAQEGTGAGGAARGRCWHRQDHNGSERRHVWGSAATQGAPSPGVVSADGAGAEASLRFKKVFKSKERGACSYEQRNSSPRFWHFLLEKAQPAVTPRAGVH